MSALPSQRAPCIHARLRALVTKPYEISGLKKPTLAARAPTQTVYHRPICVYCLDLIILSFYGGRPMLKC